MSAPNPSAPPAAEHPYAVFRNPDFVRYLLARFIASFGQQMIVVTIDWELYERTNSLLALTMVGVSMMVPMILCTLHAGHVADTYDRKKIIVATTGWLGLASLGLTFVCAFSGPKNALFPVFVYSLLLMIAVGRTFLWPASAAFITRLVPRDQLARAVTFNSGAFQLSAVLGPATAGLVIWLTHGTCWIIYAFNALAALICLSLVSSIRHVHPVVAREPVSFKTLVQGFQFVYTNKIILGTLTLDMFAVLLGGSVTLLPVFAKDILRAGPHGLGLLRAAMPIGAVLCAFVIAHRPPLQKAGRTMLTCVAWFGVATILFGLVNQACLGRFIPAADAVWFWLAFGLLAVCGAVDNVSVVVRQTLVQLLTPDEKRGRVSAVNSLFIGTSNELGGAESGFIAWVFGPAIALTNATGTMISTVVGGFGTLAVVLAVALIWPQIRRYGKLS